MSAEFKEKIRSINFGMPARRKPKATTDVHDSHTVTTTEHWNDRVDVNAKLSTVKVKGPKAEVVNG